MAMRLTPIWLVTRNNHQENGGKSRGSHQNFPMESGETSNPHPPGDFLDSWSHKDTWCSTPPTPRVPRVWIARRCSVLEAPLFQQLEISTKYIYIYSIYYMLYIILHIYIILYIYIYYILYIILYIIYIILYILYYIYIYDETLTLKYVEMVGQSWGNGWKSFAEMDLICGWSNTQLIPWFQVIEATTRLRIHKVLSEFIWYVW